MRPKIQDYLEKISQDAFDRQLEVDESIWRSLPFFATALGLAVTMLGHASSNVPPFSNHVTPLVLYAFLALSGASFAWAFRWFYEVIRPRRYLYPPLPDRIREYAGELYEYYAAVGLSGESREMKTTKDLQQLMTAEFAAAASANGQSNNLRLQARTQVLLFMMIGLSLAILAEVTMFGARTFGVNDVSKSESNIHDRPASKTASRPAQPSNANEALSPQGKHGLGRGQVQPREGIATGSNASAGTASAHARQKAVKETEHERP